MVAQFIVHLRNLLQNHARMMQQRLPGRSRFDAAPSPHALNLEKDDLMQAMGLSFTVSTIVLAVALGQSGALHAANAGTSLLALLPALAGMFAGQWMRSRIRPAVFRKCFFAGLIALGGDLVLHTL